MELRLQQRVRFIRQLFSHWMRHDPAVAFFSTPARFIRHACRLARPQCPSDGSCIAIARQAMATAQQEDIVEAAETIIRGPAYYWASRYHVEAADLAQETLLRVLPNLNRCYKAPITTDPQVRRRCLRGYLNTAVQRTARKLLGRRREVVGQAELIARVAAEVDILSEIVARDEVERLLARLDEEGRRRLVAIVRNDVNVAHAARELGMPEDRLRRWFWDWRRQVSR